MSDEILELTVVNGPHLEQPAVEVLETDHRSSLPALATVAGASLALTACGGGGGGTGSSDSGGSGSTPPVTPPKPLSEAEAARFLAQAAVGITRTQIARVQAIGYAAWIDEQIALAPSTSRWDWLKAKGFDALTYRSSESGIGMDQAVWRKLISSPDTLRQRVAQALSEILVVGVGGLNTDWRQFAACTYLDMLEANCFGNFRTLLEAVSTSLPMGVYLTFRGNTKFNAQTGALPDENYAREIMQLFTIGLVQLNLDGTPKLNSSGAQQETYTLDDIAGLARVFTGWDYDRTTSGAETPDFVKRPMIQVAARHETGEKKFLGTTIAAGTDGLQSLKAALDTIFAHPNVAPFISKQLIQRLVTSNPSPAYVTRVATIFNNDGKNVKGNLTAVVKAILLDDEARNANNLSNAQFGKVREPIFRFLAWARAFNLNSVSDVWDVGNTSDPASRLGQSPMRSGSVFNFFRPGYVPPNSPVGNASLVAPELQIVNESTVVGYVNFMQRMVSQVNNDLVPDYSSLLKLVSDPAGLVKELNLVLAAGQLSDATVSTIVSAIGGMASETDAQKNNRIYAALTLVLAAPEFIVIK
ncbi:DUF1800 domain-containing protein [Undibacterium curvum]|uniref:DUF1800 domain-containing protein n=1 Tax=Undibacterium curvum TaxID=2762294 RepID=UPI003D13FC9C